MYTSHMYDLWLPQGYHMYIILCKAHGCLTCAIWMPYIRLARQPGIFNPDLTLFLAYISTSVMSQPSLSLNWVTNI